MNQEIENIIKKNLPEKRGKSKTVDINFADGFDEAIDRVNLSLIADEVLKIIKPKIESIYKNLCLYHCAEHKLLKKEIKDLLSNLSTNKENK